MPTAAGAIEGEHDSGGEGERQEEAAGILTTLTRDSCDLPSLECRPRMNARSGHRLARRAVTRREVQGP